jgi:WD40 repeat protein
MLGQEGVERYRLERQPGLTLTSEPALIPSLFPDEYSIAVAPGGAQLVAFNGHDIEVLRGNGEHLATLRAVGTVNDAAITADGRLLAAATDGGVEVWTLDPVPHPLDHRGDWASLVTIAPDGQRLALINQGTIQLYRVSAQGLVEEQMLSGHNGQISDVAFRPFDNALISSGSDGAIWLWESGPERTP